MEQLPTILGALVLAGILWLLKGTSDNKQSLAVLQAMIEQSILPEIARLRSSGHSIRDLAQEAVSKTELLDQRATQNERNIQLLWDGQDRRGGSDRRESPA